MKVVSRAPFTRGRADTETFSVRSIALTGLFTLAVLYGVYFMRSILLAIESEASHYFSTITAINACVELAVGSATGLPGLAQPGSLHSRRDVAPARCALSAKSVLPELILFGRRVLVDSHGAGGGRNRTDPVTRHRNAGCCSERVAHFLRGLHDPLWMCRQHYVLARISSKCRCAKCERDHETRASNRRTAQATKPVLYSHAVIVIPFRILCKLIWRLFETKKRHFQHCGTIRPKIFCAQPEAAFRTGAFITTLGASAH